ncbi:MAG TPA: hypothetical protein GX705_00055 [Clostridiales bacterium]|nr:hypothetical protein [Clostridiales bacterium]
MNSQHKVKTMTIAGLLSALGILIPMIAPRFLLEPASYTLASHVPIYIAMFVSLPVAVFVAIVTGIGFTIGFPLVVALRAFSHIIFVVIGAYALSKNKNILKNKVSTILFVSIISFIHAVSEVIVVSLFYLDGEVIELYYEQGYFVSVILLVGVGTFLHSALDFLIATLVWKPVNKVVSIPVNVSFKKANTN